MSTGRRPVPVLLVVLAAALLAAGCRAPIDETPRALPIEDVPFDLLDAESSTTTSTVVPSGSTSAVTIYLIGRERLVAVERAVEAPADVEKVLKVLISGPTEEDVRKGLRTAISPGTVINSAPVRAGITTIDLAGGFAAGGLPEQILGFAQMVYTATSLGGVVGVRFTLNGQTASVSQGDGTQTQTAVGRAAYATLAPL